MGASTGIGKALAINYADEEVIDAENVRAEYVEQWIGQAGVAHTREELRDIATGVVDLVHGVNARPLVLAVADESVLINVHPWHLSLAGDNILGHLSQLVVFLMREYVFAHDIPFVLPVLDFIGGHSSVVRCGAEGYLHRDFLSKAGWRSDVKMSV